MLYRFFHCRLDTQRRILRREGVVVDLQPQAFRVLVYLLENRNRVVVKDELFENLWSGKIVGDAALNTCIRSIRKAIGDSGRTQRCIKTYHSQGYRFSAVVCEESSDDNEPSEADETDTSTDNVSTQQESSDAVLSANLDGQTPFIGRQHEMDILVDRLRYASERQGQVVNIVGDAGVGKTRLLDEFSLLAVSNEHVRCYRFQGSGVDGVRSHCLKSQALRSAALESDALPMVVQGRKDSLQRLTRHIISVPSNGTNVVVVDDAQWVDSDSAQYMEQFVASASKLPLLLIFSFRPTWQSPWSESHSVSKLTLPGLTKSESVSFVRSIGQNSLLENDVVEEIVSKAQGSPFFLEAYAMACRE